MTVSEFHGIAALRAAYAEFAGIVTHLDAVEQDIIENADAFLAPAEPPMAQAMSGKPGRADGERFRRYQVNVLVDSSGQSGAPVVYEDNPTVGNLIGQVEHQAQMGALVTDFNLIGSLMTMAAGCWSS